MSQRSSVQSKQNGASANGKEVVDHDKMAALQQYRDTEGHFSLVRCRTFPGFYYRGYHG